MKSSKDETWAWNLVLVRVLSIETSCTFSKCCKWPVEGRNYISREYKSLLWPLAYNLEGINMSTTLLDQSFLSNGNNLTNCAWNYPKFATLNLDIHIYKILGADFLLLCLGLHKWPNSAFLRHICPDLASPSQISHVRWRRRDVDVPYLTNIGITITLPRLQGRLVRKCQWWNLAPIFGSTEWNIYHGIVLVDIISQLG